MNLTVYRPEKKKDLTLELGLEEDPVTGSVFLTAHSDNFSFAYYLLRFDPNGTTHLCSGIGNIGLQIDHEGQLVIQNK